MKEDEKPIVWVPIFETIEPEEEIPITEEVISNCSAKIISISNRGLMTVELSDELLYFKKEDLNKSNADIFLIPFQSLIGNNTIDYSLTWKLIEFSTDHRRMVF